MTVIKFRIKIYFVSLMNFRSLQFSLFTPHSIFLLAVCNTSNKKSSFLWKKFELHSTCAFPLFQPKISLTLFNSGFNIKGHQFCFSMQENHSSNPRAIKDYGFFGFFNGLCISERVDSTLLPLVLRRPYLLLYEQDKEAIFSSRLNAYFYDSFYVFKRQYSKALKNSFSTQLAFTLTKLTMKTPGQCVISVQS